MASEQRFHPRFEPPFVDAVILFNQAEIRGKVLDSSISGMAIALPEDVDTPQKRDNVKIYVTKADCNHSKTEAGSASMLAVV